jgi:hypothetical protein
LRSAGLVFPVDPRTQVDEVRIGAGHGSASAAGDRDLSRFDHGAQRKA